MKSTGNLENLRGKQQLQNQTSSRYGNTTSILTEHLFLIPKRKEYNSTEFADSANKALYSKLLCQLTYSSKLSYRALKNIKTDTLLFQITLVCRGQAKNLQRWRSNQQQFTMGRGDKV